MSEYVFSLSFNTHGMPSSMHSCCGWYLHYEFCDIPVSEGFLSLLCGWKPVWVAFGLSNASLFSERDCCSRGWWDCSCWFALTLRVRTVALQQLSIHLCHSPLPHQAWEVTLLSVCNPTLQSFQQCLCPTPVHLSYLNLCYTLFRHGSSDIIFI